MGSDPPDLGKGLFGYRKSVVNQIIADRDIMLRQAEGRVRAAESKVADLESELSSMRERNGRMDEQLERLRAQLDMLASRTDDLYASTGASPWPAVPAEGEAPGEPAPFRTESIVSAIQELPGSQSSESPSMTAQPTSSTDENSYDVSPYEAPVEEATSPEPPSYEVSSYEAPSYEVSSYEIPAYYEHQTSVPRTYESESHEAGPQDPESSEAQTYEPQAYEPQAYEPPVAGADVAEADDDVLAALSYEPGEEEFTVPLPSAEAEEPAEEPSFFDAAFGEEQPSEGGAESGPPAFDANAVEVVPHPDDVLDAGSLGQPERSGAGPEAYDPSIDPSPEAEVESWSFEAPQAEMAEAEEEPEPAAASFDPGVDVQAEAPEADQAFAFEPEATLQEEGNEDMSYQADSPNVFDRAPFVSASAGDEPQASSPPEVSAREPAFAAPPFSSATAYPEAPVAPRRPDDITSKFLNEELAGILHAAEESSARIVERARATTQQQIAQSNRLWREVQAEVARFASWREEVEPVIRTVQGKVDGVRSQIEQVPERIRQALAPMADAISTIDADLAELAAACSPPLLLTPSGLEHVRQENGEWSFKAEDEMLPPAGETQAETEDGSFGANAG